MSALSPGSPHFLCSVHVSAIPSSLNSQRVEVSIQEHVKCPSIKARWVAIKPYSICMDLPSEIKTIFTSLVQHLKLFQEMNNKPQDNVPDVNPEICQLGTHEKLILWP